MEIGAYENAILRNDHAFIENELKMMFTEMIELWLMFYEKITDVVLESCCSFVETGGLNGISADR